jgi:hypothetical protein
MVIVAGAVMLPACYAVRFGVGHFAVAAAIVQGERWRDRIAAPGSSAAGDAIGTALVLSAVARRVAAGATIRS